MAYQLSFLAYLLPPRGIGRIKKQHWKPSIKECADSIIIHVKVHICCKWSWDFVLNITFAYVQIPGDIEKKIAEKQEEKQLKGLKIQSYIIVQGINSSSIDKAYVVIDEITYTFESVLRAVEICFKSYFVLNAVYPSEAEHIFQLLQFGLFKIKTEWDRPVPYIMDLINYLNDV